MLKISVTQLPHYLIRGYSFDNRWFELVDYFCADYLFTYFYSQPLNIVDLFMIPTEV